jgi:hypothetical protein
LCVGFSIFNHEVVAASISTWRRLRHDALGEICSQATVNKTRSGLPAQNRNASIAGAFQRSSMRLGRRESRCEQGRAGGAALQKMRVNMSQEFVGGGYSPGSPFDVLLVADLRVWHRGLLLRR